jgi:hypothetical protein
MGSGHLPLTGIEDAGGEGRLMDRPTTFLERRRRLLLEAAAVSFCWDTNTTVLW